MARSTMSLLSLAVLFLLLPIVLAEEPPSAEAEAEESPEMSTVGFIPPQIILGTQKQPEYPPAAWGARFTGSVLLEMTVLPDGKVGKVEVVECDRPKVGFEDAAVKAVRQWRFEPGMERGEPVEVTTRLRLNFTRVGMGMRARPQVSAGSFTVAAHDGDMGSERSAAGVGSSSGGGGDRK